MVFHKVKNCCQKFRPPHPFIYLFFIFVFRMGPYYSAHRCRGRNFGGLHCSHSCSGIGMFENSPGISMDFRYLARQLPLHPTAVFVDTKKKTRGLHAERGTATRQPSRDGLPFWRPRAAGDPGCSCSRRPEGRPTISSEATTAQGSGKVPFIFLYFFVMAITIFWYNMLYF